MPGKSPPDEERPPIPLSRWADRQLRHLAELTGSARIGSLDGAGILAERAALGGFRIGGQVSAGPGSSRLLPTGDGGWFALTLARHEDRELLPALFGDDSFDITDDLAIAKRVRQRDCLDLLRTGRTLGLAVACADEHPAAGPQDAVTHGPVLRRRSGQRPRVIDLSSLWAGPLAGHLFWLAGADVLKVESLTRPDGMRRGDPALFGVVNQGKGNVALDIAVSSGREALLSLVRQADIVIESSRPRALLQLGIDADALVREVPGLIWLSITGHGAVGECASWAGMGNDCAVAGGLSRALVQAGGRMAFVGDAVADPLTGIMAALVGWRAYLTGAACRVGLSMSAIVATALREERAYDAPALNAELRGWDGAVGQPFPAVTGRAVEAVVAPFGADTAHCLARLRSC